MQWMGRSFSQYVDKIVVFFVSEGHMQIVSFTFSCVTLFNDYDFEVFGRLVKLVGTDEFS